MTNVDTNFKLEKKLTVTSLAELVLQLNLTYVRCVTMLNLLTFNRRKYEGRKSTDFLRGGWERLILFLTPVLRVPHAVIGE